MTEKILPEVSRESLEAILDLVSDGIWDWNGNTGYVYRSPSCYTMLGYDVNAFENTAFTWKSVIHPDDFDRVMFHFDSYTTHKSPTYQIEYRCRMKSGDFLWIEDRGEVVHWNEDGSVSRMIGANRDISTKKILELALRESEERYRFFIDNVSEGVLVSVEGKITDASDVLLHMFACKLEDLLGRSPLEHVATSHQDQIQKVLDTRSSEAYESTLLRNDGTEFPALLKGRNLTFGGSDVRFTAISDITRQKENEAALRESEERYRLFSDNIDEGIMITEEGQVIDASDTWLEMFGYSMEDVIDRSSLSFVAVLDRDKAIERIIDRRSDTYELNLLRADGTDFPARVRGHNLIFGGRNVRLTTTLDVTKQKETETALLDAKKEADKANRAKSDFLASMSHEVRTPLTGVLGMVDMILDTELDNTQRSYVRTIQQSGQVLTTVINDILEFSKMEAGSLELEKRSFNLPIFIEHIDKIYQAQASDNVQMEVIINPSTPTYLTGDDTRLHQIIGNLLNNAFKFTAKGLITLRVEPLKNQPDFICFSITDTGIGISEETQKDLFQPFKQADQSTSRRYGGTGLGLVICQRLVKLMEGEIEVNSEVDKGAKFRFTVKLPYVAAPSSLAAKSINVAPQKTATYDQLNVLLVEDNLTNQLVVTRMLEKLNIRFTIANNGIEAVKLVCNSNEKFNVILMDCEMPIMDGYEATRRIRQWESTKELKPSIIYALTAHVLNEHVAMSKAAGMNEHITKPIRFSDLTTVFERIEVKG